MIRSKTSFPFLDIFNQKFPPSPYQNLLHHTAPFREIDTFSRRRIAEPAYAIASALVDQATRQLSTLLRLENALENVFLSSTGADECYARSVLHNGERKGNALGRRLRRVLDAQHPGVGLAQLRVAGEKRAGVSIGPAAKEQQVEKRQLNTIARSENRHKSLLVRVGCFLRVVEQRLVNGEDLGRSKLGGDFGQQLFLHEPVVGVLVSERHAALVGVEDLPLAEIGAVGFVAGAGGEKGFCEDFGQRAAGDGDAEGVVAFNGFVLRFEDVAAEVGREVFVDVCEGVEVYGAASHGCGCVCVLGWVRLGFWCEIGWEGSEVFQMKEAGAEEDGEVTLLEGREK
jgi:hypothetical protein